MDSRPKHRILADYLLRYGPASAKFSERRTSPAADGVQDGQQVNFEACH